MRFWFGSGKEDCRDIVGTDNGAVRRRNKVLQRAGYIQDNETMASPRLDGMASTIYARSAETFRAQTQAVGGSEKRSCPIGKATAVRTAPAEPRRKIGMND